MKQLVELGKNNDKFQAANTKIIAVFREESQGEQGLKKIVKKTDTPFVMALDNGKTKTARYSSGSREFTGYVISSKGKVIKIIKGDLKTRATSDQLLAAILSDSESKATDSHSKD